MKLKRVLTLTIIALALAVGACAQQVSLIVSDVNGNINTTQLTGSTEIYVASFSDHSPVIACVWSAGGTGQNGVAIYSSGNNLAAFSAGNRGGLTYTITATCAGQNGITATGSDNVNVVQNQ